MRKVLLTVLTVFCMVICAKSQSYQEGYYYNTNGQKMTGLIRISPGEDHLLFKTDEKGSSQKIKIENIRSVVLASDDPADSLTVVAEKDKKYFGKLMVATPTTRFYVKFLIFRPRGGANQALVGTANINATGSQPSFTESYQQVTTAGFSGAVGMMPMYEEGGTTYPLTNKNYVEVLSKAFADYPELADQIKNKEYKYRELNDVFEKYKAKHK